MWIRWKRKRSYRMREICLLMLYMSLQVRLRPQLLRTLYTILLPKKTICTINLHIIHAGVLISFLYLFTFWPLPKCGWPSGLAVLPLAVVGQ